MCNSQVRVSYNEEWNETYIAIQSLIIIRCCLRKEEKGLQQGRKKPLFI